MPNGCDSCTSMGCCARACVTGMRIIQAIVAGERDPAVLATHRDRRCHASAEDIAAALTGNWREEHVFALGQALELYDFSQAKIAECGAQTAAVLARLKDAAVKPVNRLPPARHGDKTANAPAFDARAERADNGRTLHGWMGEAWEGPTLKNLAGVAARLDLVRPIGLEKARRARCTPTVVPSWRVRRGSCRRMNCCASPGTPARDAGCLCA